tara:strand:+ start:7569 stop:8000 length:432 start_codon:yes stop_codon:yes gene_type:complete
MNRHNPSRKRREFSKLSNKYVSRNHLKQLSLVVRDVKSASGVGQAELELMLFIYDYEFFTITHVAAAMSKSRTKLYRRTILPLKKKGFIENVFHGKNVDSFVNALFKDADEKGSESRLGLSKKGRLFVQRFYRKLDGQEPIKV